MMGRGGAEFISFCNFMKMKWCGEEWGVLSDRKEAADQEIEDILDTCQSGERGEVTEHWSQELYSQQVYSLQS